MSLYSLAKPSYGDYISYANNCKNKCYKTCVPQASETGCKYGITTCSNGCDEGNRSCCLPPLPEPCYHKIIVNNKPIYLYYYCDSVGNGYDDNPSGYGCFPQWQYYGDPNQILATAKLKPNTDLAYVETYPDELGKGHPRVYGGYLKKLPKGTFFAACSTKGPIVEYYRGFAFFVMVDGIAVLANNHAIQPIFKGLYSGNHKISGRGWCTSSNITPQNCCSGPAMTSFCGFK